MAMSDDYCLLLKASNLIIFLSFCLIENQNASFRMP